jgi:hypothetical protein
MVKNSSPSPLRLRLEIGDASKRGGETSMAVSHEPQRNKNGPPERPKVFLQSLFVFKSRRKRK